MAQEANSRAAFRRDKQTWRNESAETKRIANVFKISIAEARDLARRVFGPCDACGLRPTKRVNSVDHDHRTGKVRGILCQPCNQALGCINDSEQKLLNLIVYLRK